MDASHGVSKTTARAGRAGCHRDEVLREIGRSFRRGPLSFVQTVNNDFGVSEQRSSNKLYLL